MKENADMYVAALTQ